MQLNAITAAGIRPSTGEGIEPPSTAGLHGRPVIQVDGVDRARGETAPMRVFARGPVGRHTGYGSLHAALSAARNLSRGSDRPALVVERDTQGAYRVLDAVWQYLWAPGVPSRATPMRHFHFEDGTPSQYTAWKGDQRIVVEARNHARSWDGLTRWLVDGSRVSEVTASGGRLV
jgi:hypothetical protein